LEPGILIKQGLPEGHYVSHEYVNVESPALYDDIHRISNQILLTGYYIEKDCQEFLNDNLDIPFEIPRINEIANQVTGTELNPVFEIITDEESLELKRLAIIFKIKGYSYDQILRIWDNVSEKVYAGLNTITAQKISVILDND
jgi:hypothetical protein